MDQLATAPGARRRARWLAPTLALLAIAPLGFGCGSSGPEKATVRGQVTYQGNPVRLGTVSFIPVDAENGRGATGQIDPEGYYSLQTEEPGDGAQLGEYLVTISAREDPVLDYIPKKPVPPKRLVPEKYENPQTSGLRATVKSGSNDIPFKLE